MISILQCFYMIPQFRYSIMQANDGVEPTNIRWLRGEEVDTSVKGYDIDDNILHQLQRMYGFLELTDRQAYDPAPFCFAYKDFDGNPTPVGVQQDA